MKRITIFAAIILSVIAITAQAQDNNQFRKHLTTKVDIFVDMLQETPENMDLKTVNRGVNISSMYNFPIKNTALGFDIGAGLGVHNLYHENTLEKNDDGILQFGNIPDTLAGGQSTEVDNSKVTFTYLDVPMEFKIETESKLRAAIGFKLGLLISSKNKYKGDNYMEGSKDNVKIKKKSLDGTNRLRYGPTIRLGYKWINLYGYYSLSTFFEENKGPEMAPVSIGISVVKF